MLKKGFNWIRNKVKSFFGAIVLFPAKIIGAVGDTLTSAALWLYKGTPKYNTLAENLSTMYADLSNQYDSFVDYGTVIEELVEADESASDETVPTDTEPEPTT